MLVSHELTYILGCILLKDLNLANNKLKYIPLSLGFLKNLIKLNLADNDINELPSTMSHLCKLSNLIIDAEKYVCLY
jgi:Leucine-rich repeat (LRR) protein